MLACMREGGVLRKYMRCVAGEMHEAAGVQQRHKQRLEEVVCLYLCVCLMFLSMYAD